LGGVAIILLFLGEKNIFVCLKIENNMNNLTEHISCNPQIMFGKPVIKGTRITVELILEKLGAGETFEDILEAHPRITLAAIYAALSFG